MYGQTMLYWYLVVGINLLFAALKLKALNQEFPAS